VTDVVGEQAAGRAPIAVALDAPDADTAVRWAASVAPHVAVVKVGLELFYRAGPSIVERVRSAGGNELFLDLKLHDIPHTVAGAVRAVAALHPRYLTVHAVGGADMVRAAVDAAEGVTIAGVTVLTSMDEAALAGVGLAGPAADAVLRLAGLAVGAGAGALVISQFTLAADTSRGNRPGFSAAAPPDEAEALYLNVAKHLENMGISTQTGQFGAEMQVDLTNDGPMTIWLDI
jgi:orotidine 5'-phosphate decarboxylase subfamily 1